MQITFKHSVLSLLLFFFGFSHPLLQAKAGRSKQLYHFDFAVNNEKWQGDFTDYPVGDETFFELAWGWSPLPVPLPVDGNILTQGLFLTGNNHSDDLFMFVKRKIGGLVPNTKYKIVFDVTIENNVPPGQIGIGGSPGESVYFKVGASTIEPNKVGDTGFYELNVDKGNQAQGGRNAIVVGDLANPLVNPIHPTFEPKQFTNEGHSLIVRTNDRGELWIFVGTDSGFEGKTLYYIADISVSVAKAHCKKRR